ncbi:MAG: NAD-dependent epimerase/dehydratase family protein, partial [Gaiellaceae bacterium]
MSWGLTPRQWLFGTPGAFELRSLSKIVVTGASGKAGRAVVRALREREHDVLVVDVVPPTESAAPFLLADLTDFGQTVECLAGGDPIGAVPADRGRLRHPPLDPEGAQTARIRASLVV